MIAPVSNVDMSSKVGEDFAMEEYSSDNLSESDLSQSDNEIPGPSDEDKVSESGDVSNSDNVSDIENAECDNSDQDGFTGSSHDNDDLDKEANKLSHNPGWADAMAKILKTNKPKRKKSIVLAKAKKLKSEPDEKEVIPFEIDGAETEETAKEPVKTLPKKELKQEPRSKIEKRWLESKGRVKPSVLDKDRERVLQRVATKGIVQLFNTVRQQQKNIQQEIKKVGPSERKQEKVLKSVDKKAFLDILMGAKSQTVPQVKEEEKSEWSVLRDDFMMSSKLKDWDKQDEEKNSDIE